MPRIGKFKFFFVFFLNLNLKLNLNNRKKYSFFVTQLNHAMQRQKTLFDNVNIDWNLSHDEASTDFSDDETIIEERVSAEQNYSFLKIY